MSNLNGRKVTSARLHAATHITGLGNIGPVIDRNNKSVNSGAATLSYQDGGILVTNTKTGAQAVIPTGNVQSIELEAQAEKSS